MRRPPGALQGRRAAGDAGVMAGHDAPPSTGRRGIMLKRLRNWAVTLLVLAAIGGGLFEWWNLDVRWRPHEIAKNQAEIGKILSGAGWVSPGLSGPKLYMISFRACPDCIRYEETEFPKLQAAGVDTRVILVALPDVNGAAHSTAVERSTVAELWVNRSWPLYQKWMTTPIAAWTAPNIPPADGDVARSAVVEAGRDAVARLTELLRPSGVRFAYPTLIWWSKTGQMMGCACENPKTYANVRKDLGVD
jgi:hypothetical protein